jgi:hypothetical protein
MPHGSFDLDGMMETLAANGIGGRPGRLLFNNECRWNDDIRVFVNTKYHVLVERKLPALDGTEHWITKSLRRLNIADFRKREAVAAAGIMEDVRKVAESSLDAPADQPGRDVETLTLEIADKIDLKANRYFFFEQVRRKVTGEYVIRFSVLGGGRGLVPGGGANIALVESLEVRVAFVESVGLFHVMGINILRDDRGNDWIPTPCGVDFWFAPTQKDQEMSETVSSSLEFF